MGYRADGKLENLFPSRFIDEVSREIVEKVGERFRDRVAKRTPVARLPSAYKGDFEEWIKDRHGRTPRTARDSWRTTDVQTEDGMLRVEIFSDEPPDEHGWQVVDYLEEDTRPHLIRAKPRIRINQRTGHIEAYQGSLRFPYGASFAYRVQVEHPGTQGLHLVRDTAAELETMWIEIGEEVLERKAAEFSRV